MKKGVAIGIVICISVLLVSYFGGKFIYQFKGFGGAILISFIPFLAGIFAASFFYNNKSEIISSMSKTILAGLSLLLLIWALFLFR